MTEIQKFYQNKTVFLTGGTGFLGKVMIEKLLRSTDTAMIYLLVRDKRGVPPKARLHQLLSSKLFDRVRAEKDNFQSRVTALEGDIEKPMLGLSVDDQRRLIEEVEIVIHSAATVRFNEALSKALLINVSSVSSIISLCKKMKRLESLVHVSTAYSHCQRPHIEERSYPPPMEPSQALNMLETVDRKVLDSPEFTKEVIGERPNTYTFTKALGEDLIMTEARDLPGCIVRPSFVLPTWKDPVPGWLDNYNGPTGLFLMDGLGVMRTGLIHPDLKFDVVPVDTCVNHTLAAAWRTSLDKRVCDIPKIYNYTSGGKVPITWAQLFRTAEFHLRQNPLEGMVWYPGGTFLEHRPTVNRMLEIVLNEAPAKLADLSCTILDKKPFAGQLCSRLQKILRLLEYFMTQEWTWDTANTDKLAHSLDEKDRELFYFQLDRLDWGSFMEEYILGMRKFLLKQDPITIPDSRNRMYLLWIADRILKVFIIYLFYIFFTLLFSLLI